MCIYIIFSSKNRSIEKEDIKERNSCASNKLEWLIRYNNALHFGSQQFTQLIRTFLSMMATIKRIKSGQTKKLFSKHLFFFSPKTV